MSTNANIMMLNEDGTVDTIYNHWDGDIDFLGRKLNEYYRDDYKVRQLIDLGSISQLGAVTDASPLVREFGFDALSSPEVKSVIGDSISNEPGSSADKVYDAFMLTEHYFTTAYHRDRGEELSIGHYDNVDQVPLLEFNYLYIKDDDGNLGYWLVKGEDEDYYHSLTTALVSEK